MAVRPAAAEAPKAEAAKPKRETTRSSIGPGSLAGNLTRDPELRYTPQGIAVVSLRVAVQERILNEQTKEWEDGPAEFYDVTAWRALAENCAEHLARGYRIVAEGTWERQSWEGEDGTTQTRDVLVAADLGPSMRFAGARVQPRRQARP